MSKRVVFYNYDPEEIRSVLTRMGKLRFEEATSHITHIPSYKISKFRIIYRNRTCSLQYNDIYKNYIAIMVIEDTLMPLKGWTMTLDGW